MGEANAPLLGDWSGRLRQIVWLKTRFQLRRSLLDRRTFNRLLFILVVALLTVHADFSSSAAAMNSTIGEDEYLEFRLVNPKMAPVAINVPRHLVDNNFSIFRRDKHGPRAVKTLAIKLTFPEFMDFETANFKSPSNERDLLLLSVSAAPWPIVAKLWEHRKKAQYRFYSKSEFGIDEYLTRDELAIKRHVTYRIFHFLGDQHLSPHTMQCHAGKPSIVMCQMTGEIKLAKLFYNVRFLKAHMKNWHDIATRTSTFLTNFLKNKN